MHLQRCGPSSDRGADGNPRGDETGSPSPYLFSRPRAWGMAEAGFSDGWPRLGLSGTHPYCQVRKWSPSEMELGRAIPLRRHALGCRAVGARSHPRSGTSLAVHPSPNRSTIGHRWKDLRGANLDSLEDWYCSNLLRRIQGSAYTCRVPLFQRAPLRRLISPEECGDAPRADSHGDDQGVGLGASASWRGVEPLFRACESASRALESDSRRLRSHPTRAMSATSRSVGLRVVSRIPYEWKSTASGDPIT